MKNVFTAIGTALLLAGCTAQPELDVSGEWHFFHGGHFSLVQDGRELAGSGHILTDNLPTGASDPRIPITARGKVEGKHILLTFECGTNTLEDVEFLPAISPKGNKRFLKCPQNLGLTLLPEGVDAFTHEILKPELTELREKQEGSQQPVGGDSERRADAPPGTPQP